MANLDNIEPFLSLAVKKGNLDTVKSLIEKGADINAVDNEGNTPLHLATKDNKLQYKTDKLDLVKFLVSRGADINAKNNDGKTVIDAATDLNVREYLNSISK